MINVGMGTAVGASVGKGTRPESVGIMKVGNIRAGGEGLGVLPLNGVELAAGDEVVAVGWSGYGGV